VCVPMRSGVYPERTSPAGLVMAMMLTAASGNDTSRTASGMRRASTLAIPSAKTTNPAIVTEEPRYVSLSQRACWSKDVLNQNMASDPDQALTPSIMMTMAGAPDIVHCRRATKATTRERRAVAASTKM